MTDSRKRIIKIAAFCMLLFMIGVSVWYFNDRSGGELLGGELPESTPREETPGNTSEPIGTIITEGGEATKEIAKNVINAVFAPNSDTVRYIERATGLVYEKALSGGTAIALSDKQLANAYVADWAVNGAGALVTLSSDGSTANFAHIAFTSSSSVATMLPPETLFAAVSPDGTRVAFVKAENSGSHIASALPNGTKPITLALHPQTQLLMSWDVAARPIIWNPGSAFAESLVWSVSGKVYTQLIPAGYQLSVSEHPSGRYLLYSRAEKSTDTPTLTLLDSKAKTAAERITTATFSTYPEKCAWARTSATVVYCAVPKEIPKQSYDAWLRGETHFTDRILQWNFLTGEVKTIAEGNFDAIELAVAPDDSSLLFVNKNDSSLWSHSLK